MDLHFTNYQPHGFISSFGKQLNIEPKTDCWEKTLLLTKQFGSGKITAFNFDDGLTFILFDCLIYEDWRLNFTNESVPPLQFSICSNGEIWHILKNGSIRFELKPMQSSISASKIGHKQSLILEKNKQLLFAIIMVNRESYLPRVKEHFEEMDEKMATAFKDVKGENIFLHQSNFTISMARGLKKITSDENCGFTRSIFIEAKMLDLLGQHIQLVEDDFSMIERKVKLREYDLEKIQLARNFLVSDLKNAPTIVNLAKQTGINQQKLKTGFKLVYGNTINQYLTKERMEKASLLIMKGSSIKDAAEEVGYSNFSHFSKRFKAHFGVLPKNYMTSIEARISTTT